jgi:hypothetical protein
MKAKKMNGDEELRELEHEYLASYPNTSEQLETAIKSAYKRTGVTNWKGKFLTLEDKARLARPLEDGQRNPETTFWVVRVTGGKKAADLEKTVYQDPHFDMIQWGRDSGPMGPVWRAIKKLGKQAEKPGNYVWVWSSDMLDTAGRVNDLGVFRREVRPRKGALPHWSYKMTKAGYATYMQTSGVSMAGDDLVWLSPYRPKTTKATKAVLNNPATLRDGGYFEGRSRERTERTRT